MSQNEPYVAGGTERTETLPDRLVEGLFDAGGQVWDVFEYSSLYITTIALVEVSIAMVLLGVDLNPAPAVVGLVTFAVYTNDKIADVETDALSDPKRAAFVRRHEDLLYIAAAAAYGLAVTLAVLGGPMALAITLLPGAFWVLYASDWLDGISATVYRLKEILVVNTAMVALAWAVTITFLPLAFASGPIPVAVIPVFAYLLLRDYVHTEVPNLPDRESDAKVGIDTIPSRYGPQRTRQALYVVNLLTALLVLVTGLQGYLELAVVAALTVGVGYSLLVNGLIGRWQRETTLSKLAEAEYLLTLTCLFVFVVVS